MAEQTLDLGRAAAELGKDGEHALAVPARAHPGQAERGHHRPGVRGARGYDRPGSSGGSLASALAPSSRVRWNAAYTARERTVRSAPFSSS